MLVVDLADEFGLTSGEALDVCDRAGIPARDGGTVLTAADVDAFRAVMAQRPHEPEPEPAPDTTAAALGGWVNDPPADPEPASARGASGRPSTSLVGGGSSTAIVRVNSPAFVALVLALLPIAALYYGYAGFFLAIPTFWFAAKADRQVRAAPGPARYSQMAIVARFLALMIAFAGFAGVIAWNAGTLDERPSVWVAEKLKIRPHATEPGDGPVVLLPGDCVVSTSRTTGSGTIDGVRKVACTDPHDAEVTRTFTIPALEAASGVALPAPVDRTSPTFDEAVKRACLDELEQLTGGNRSAMAALAIVPSQKSWDAGDQDVACAVGGPNGAQTIGSVTGN